MVRAFSPEARLAAGREDIIMNDHTTPMTDSWANTLEDIQLAVQEQENRDNDTEFSGMTDTVDDLVLCVDTEIIRDVMLGVGGPTRFVRFIFSADSEYKREGIIQRETFGTADVKRIEYHDSWGANGVTSITLNDDETAEMVAAFGFMVGIE